MLKILKTIGDLGSNMAKKNGGSGISVQSILLCTSLILWSQISSSEIIRYASKHSCDRHSLDAVYYEKYKPITENIFTDSREFVNRVSDLVSDSLTTVMSQLPDRNSSDNQERKIHEQYKGLKINFASKVKKMQKNISSTWEDLVTTSFDLMYDNGKASLEMYVDKTVRMADSYSESRKMLDTILSAFVGFIKATVRDGLQGIEAAAELAVKEDEEERNKTEEAKNESSKDKSKDEQVREKMVEISKMIVPGFLGNVTIKVIENKVNLKKELKSKAEDRDNPMDDIVFDMLMIKHRIRAIVQSDVPRDKGAVDLARRSIYTYWADIADEMYKERIESQKSGQQNSVGKGTIFYKNLWKDEDQLVETLLGLMEVYS